MNQFKGEETTEDSKHYEILKIIEDESAAYATDRHEIVEQNLTEKEAKEKVVELTESTGSD